MLEEDTLFIVNFNCDSAQVSCLEWVGAVGLAGQGHGSHVPVQRGGKGA